MVENKDYLSILKDLVSLRSDVDSGSRRNEAEIRMYITRFFRDLPGWKVAKQRVENGRYNIVATSSSDPKTVFFGHMDTVPVTNERQLKPTVKGNRFFGRGAVDMKAGLALMLSLAKEQAWEDVEFVFTVGEEYDLCGAAAFIFQCKDWKPKLIINPEPTDLQLLTACRGIAEITVRLRGKTAHAGRKQEGVNAIEKSIIFCEKLEAQIQRFDTQNLRSSLNLASLSGGVLQDGEIICRANMVPDVAQIFIELRLGCKDLTRNSLKKLVRKTAKECSLGLLEYQTGIWFEPLVSSGNKALQNFRRSITECGVSLKEQDPNESGFFEVALLKQIWNCPCVVFGPGPFAKAHQGDEYVDIREMAKTRKVLVSYLTKTRKDEVQ